MPLNHQKIDEVMVNVSWDTEGSVWVAESPNVPGLVTEATTMELLIDKLRCLIPELLTLNKHLTNKKNTEVTIPFHIISERTEYISVVSE